MWCYKIRYYEDGSYHNAEGFVAGLDMVDAITRLKKYYSKNAIEDIHMRVIESSDDGVLDFYEFPNVKYAAFFPEEE